MSTNTDTGWPEVVLGRKRSDRIPRDVYPCLRPGYPPPLRGHEFETYKPASHSDVLVEALRGIAAGVTDREHAEEIASEALDQYQAGGGS